MAVKHVLQRKRVIAVPLQSEIIQQVLLQIEKLWELMCHVKNLIK